MNSTKGRYRKEQMGNWHGTEEAKKERRKNNKQKVEARTAVEPDKAGIKMEDRMGEQRRRGSGRVNRL